MNLGPIYVFFNPQITMSTMQLDPCPRVGLILKEMKKQVLLGLRYLHNGSIDEVLDRLTLQSSS